MPQLQSSRKVRMTTYFPGTRPDPAGLWPEANGLQSLRFGIWASCGALSFGSFGGNSGANFLGVAKFPGNLIAVTKRSNVRSVFRSEKAEDF